jgi:hypothetical protein
VSEASAPARVAVLRLCSSSTMTRLTLVSRQTPQTGSMTLVMLARAETGRPRNRANSTAIILAVAAGGTVT